MILCLSVSVRSMRDCLCVYLSVLDACEIVFVCQS